VIASPEKYVGEFLRVKGFAREGKPTQDISVMPMLRRAGPHAAADFWPIATCSVEHRLFVSHGQQDQALYLREDRMFGPFSSVRDFFEKHSGIDLREISVTGTLVVADSPSGYALRVVDILKLITPPLGSGTLSSPSTNKFSHSRGVKKQRRTGGERTFYYLAGKRM
jgi:hypothetical protein